LVTPLRERRRKPDALSLNHKKRERDAFPGQGICKAAKKANVRGKKEKLCLIVKEGGKGSCPSLSDPGEGGTVTL